MARIAMIQSGVVANVANWNGTSSWSPSGYTLIDITSQPTVAVGYTWDGSVFTAPAFVAPVYTTYGSSSQVPVINLDSQNALSSMNMTGVDKLYDHWHGTTQYQASQLRKYTNITTTDANGRATVNLTENGSAGGNSLFTTILSYAAIGIDASGTATQVPAFVAETVTLTQIVFRAVKGTQTAISIFGINVLSMQYASSGITTSVKVIGVK